ncbi:coiled-coil domain-containing protein 62 [Rhynchocyon petersi]
MNTSAIFTGRQNIGSELEVSTVEKQRKELQLLIGELKDRDRELNDMVAVHQRQLLSWEEDRQKVLTLEERCSKLEGELHKRSEIIRSLVKKVKTLESNQSECQMNLQKTQQQLQEMAQKATHASLLSEDLEARNQHLSSTLVDLSAQVGQLQAREQALTTMIKLKDKDIIEAVNHIADCSGKFKLLEHALRDAKMVETSVVKEKQDYKQKLKTLKVELGKLKEELNEKTTENNDQREEIIRLKQEKSYLQDELAFTVEREKRKDDLLEIAKSKQERTNTELHNLRQIYVKQQRDLQFLHFNVDSSHELVQVCDSRVEELKALESSGDLCLIDLENSRSKASAKREKDQKLLVQDQKFEALVVQQMRSDRSSSDGDKDKKLVVCTSCRGKSATSFPCLCAKDTTEKHKSWALGGKIQIEPENKSTLCEIHAKSPTESDTGILKQERQPSETCSADEKQWHDFSVYLGLASCSGCRPPAGDCPEERGRSELPCCHHNQASPSVSDICDSKCCHPSNFVVEAPGHISDVQWMSMFKPCKTERIVRRKSPCSCADSVSEAKCDPVARMRVDQAGRLSRPVRIPGTPQKELSVPSPRHWHASLPACLPAGSASAARSGHLFCQQESVPGHGVTHVEPVITVHPSSCLLSPSSALRGDEKFAETDSASDKKNSSRMLFINHDAALPSVKDEFSPTSKLQRLLAESRQMVSDLELSTLLPLSSEQRFNSGDQNTLSPVGRIPVSQDGGDGLARVLFTALGRVLRACPGARGWEREVYGAWLHRGVCAGAWLRRGVCAEGVASAGRVRGAGGRRGALCGGGLGA